jgi:D-hydroxyproline dehydrogenase subunit gamma
MAGLRITGGVKRAPLVSFTFDGRPYQAPAGESLAAALLASGVRTLRASPGAGAPRGAFCWMGVCQECLVDIGDRCQEACRVPVTAGLEARSTRRGR